MFSKSIGAPKVQTVKWDDVGGLINIKEEIMAALKPSTNNIRRSGIISLKIVICFFIECKKMFAQPLLHFLYHRI